MNSEQNANQQPLEPGVQTSVDTVIRTAEQNQMTPQMAAAPQETAKEKTKETDEVIGTVKADTQKSPLAILILFGILIASIYYIPEITPYFKPILAYFHVSTDGETHHTEIKTPTVTDTDEEDDIAQEDKQYEIASNPVIKLGNLEFSEFKLESKEGAYTLSYHIINKGIDAYDFEKNKVYVDLYDADNTYLRSVVVEEERIASAGSLVVTTPIENNQYLKTTKVEVVIRKEEDYAQVTLNNNLLTCQKGNQEIKYSFDEELKLIGITDSQVVDNATTEEMLEIKQKMDELNDITGIAATFIQTGITSYTTLVTIPYEQEIEPVDDKNYYTKNTSAKRIKFEMMAKGYTCS